MDDLAMALSRRFGLEPILWTAVLAAASAAVVTAVALVLLRRFLPGKGGAAAAAPAIGLGVLAGWVVVAGLPRVPPRERWQWLFFFVALAAVVGWIEAHRPDSKWAYGKWFRRALAAAIAVLLVHGFVPSTWVALVLALGILAVGGALDFLGGHAGLRPMLVCLFVVASLAAVAMERSGTMKYAQIAGGLAAAVAACAVLDAWRPVAASGAGFVGAGLLGGLLVASVVFSTMPVWAAVLVGIAPLVGAVLPQAILPARPWGATAVRAAVAAAVAGAGVAIAAANAPEPYY